MIKLGILFNNRNRVIRLLGSGGLMGMDRINHTL